VLIRGDALVRVLTAGPAEWFALYADMHYASEHGGGADYGIRQPFQQHRVGEWQSAQLLLVPTRPLFSVIVFAVLAHQTGAIYFANITFQEALYFNDSTNLANTGT